MKTTNSAPVTVTLDGVTLYSGNDAAEIARARAMVAAEYAATRNADTRRFNRRASAARKRNLGK